MHIDGIKSNRQYGCKSLSQGQLIDFFVQLTHINESMFLEFLFKVHLIIIIDNNKKYIEWYIWN